MKASTTSSRLKQIMLERSLRQVDVLLRCKPYCEKFNVKLGRNDLSQYLSGKVQPGQSKLTILGLALGVSEVWLMGYDVPMHRQEKDINVHEYKNVSPIATTKIPFLGKIACGRPIFCDEDKESYIEAGTKIKADFCLRCKGDSMIEARIFDGDIVFIKEQKIVNNGEIAAVIIDDEVTLKRVYYYPEKGKLVLQPANPKYEPLVYVDEELNEINILGKAIAFQSDVI